MRCVVVAVVGYDDNWWGNNGDPHASPILEKTMFTVAREIYLIIFILLSMLICMNMPHVKVFPLRLTSDLFFVGCWLVQNNECDVVVRTSVVPLVSEKMFYTENNCHTYLGSNVRTTNQKKNSFRFSFHTSIKKRRTKRISITIIIELLLPVYAPNTILRHFPLTAACCSIHKIQNPFN